MKMSKKMVVCLALSMVILVSGLVGCSKEKTLDLDQFVQSVTDQVEYDDEMIQATDNVIANYYDLEFEGIEDKRIYTSGTRATANELAVFKLADSDALQKAEEAVTARKEKLQAEYQDYRPDQVYRIENALIIKEGNYLLFSISNDNETIEKIFSDSLK